MPRKVSDTLLHATMNNRWSQQCTLLSVRTAAKRMMGLPLDRKSCSTVMAGASSRAVTSRSEPMARAACNVLS